MQRRHFLVGASAFALSCTRTAKPPTAPLLEGVERETAPKPTHTILWLHGLGADGNDFVPVIPQLVQPTWPAVRFVFPHAPLRPITIRNGASMRAWYDITSMEPNFQVDERTVRDSVSAIDALLEREVERGTPLHRIVVGGFSQGGGLSLAIGLHRMKPLAGIVSLGSRLTAFHHADDIATPARTQPVFLGNGTQDSWVPLEQATATAKTLRDAGFTVEAHQYEMGHQVSGEELAHLSQWLTQRLTST